MLEQPKQYSFFYQNINGLTIQKLNFLENNLKTEISKILIISEHWFSSFNELENSPFFITSSSLSKTKKTTGHANGGLALLASPTVKNQITNITITEFSISFMLCQETFTAVYFPPRLSDTEIKENLLTFCKKSSVIFGDINVRYGTSFDDDRTWNINRGNTISKTLIPHQFLHLKCSNGCSRNDHIFSKNKFDWNYYWNDPNEFQSDHGFIQFSLNLSRTEQFEKKIYFVEKDMHILY
jgi:hypothetical protein